MLRKFPTPPTPPEVDDTAEFAKPLNFQLKSGDPADFARLTEGSSQVGGRSEVRQPGR